MNAATRTDFLRALFPDLKDAWIEVRVLPSKKQAFGEPGDLELEMFVRAQEHENLYFGVASRVERNGELGGDIAHCGTAWALWADLDFKSTPEAAARKIIETCPTAPSIVVHSGGGLHVYWL